jgi:hypothetical protein
VIPPFKAESHKGHKVEAKGLIYHAPSENRLNLLALQSVAGSCSN